MSPDQSPRRLRVLCLEDSPVDAELVSRALSSSGYAVEMSVAGGREEFEESLERGGYDVILADFSLPDFDGHAALALAQAACPSTPFICVSGTIGEEATVEILKEGAVDCVLKDRLARLPFAVQRAIDESAHRREQEAAAAELARASAQWRRTFDAMGDSVAVFGREGRVLRCNLATSRLTGRDADDLVGRPCYEVFHGTDDYHENCPQRRSMASGRPESGLIEQGGAWLRISFQPEIDDAGCVCGGVHVVTDVSELVETGLELRESESRFEAFAEHLPGYLFMHDDERRYVYVNRREETDGGVPRADWFGRTAAQVWPGEMGDREDARVQRALEGETVDEVVCWAPQGLHEYMHSIYFRIPRQGRPPLVGGLSIDVTEQVEAQTEVRDQAQQLLRTVEGAVLAMSRVVEARDPYAAGHERRVSELAMAVARHLGFDEEGVRAVHMAGMLHDVGKIIVPAEILNKPGRLTAHEFELIKGHAQAAVEILRPIEFDAPIAEIVLQHHERLDGSGYPRRLSGDEILPAARILAVADVVEAMSSHRPYRAALGIEPALEEIRQNAGVKYDSDAAAACAQVFAEGFEFTD